MKHISAKLFLVLGIFAFLIVEINCDKESSFLEDIFGFWSDDNDDSASTESIEKVEDRAIEVSGTLNVTCDGNCNIFINGKQVIKDGILVNENPEQASKDSTTDATVETTVEEKEKEGTSDDAGDKEDDDKKSTTKKSKKD